MDCVEEIQAGLAALELPTAPAARLSRYLDLISRWNRVVNLTSIDEPREMVALHLLDSAAVSPFLRGNNVLDVGSGAGLPGIPLALLNPTKNFILLDSNGKKTRFMTQAVIELALENVTVVQARIEEFEGQYDHIICRAFSSLESFYQSCRSLLAPGGTLLAMKGPAAEEIPGGSSLVHDISVPGLHAKRCLVELSP